MKVDKKDLEELYDLVSELFFCADVISERYYWELQGKFDAIKINIEGELL